IGALGLLIAFGAARGASNEISADTTGLSKPTGGVWQCQARWDAITGFYVRHKGGDRYLYLAIRKADFPVAWSARERSRDGGRVIDGRRYITRDEFSAVVAERLGTPLKTLTRARKQSKADA